MVRRKPHSHAPSMETIETPMAVFFSPFLISPSFLSNLLSSLLDTIPSLLRFWYNHCCWCWCNGSYVYYFFVVFVVVALLRRVWWKWETKHYKKKGPYYTNVPPSPRFPTQKCPPLGFPRSFCGGARTVVVSKTLLAKNSSLLERWKKRPCSSYHPCHPTLSKDTVTECRGVVKSNPFLLIHSPHYGNGEGRESSSWKFSPSWRRKRGF